MKFYQDQDGVYCAEEKGQLALLADFLQSDIQGDAKAAVELLDLLERKSGERIGNAYNCLFDDKKVTLTGLHGDEMSLEVDRITFFQAVEAWIMFVSN